MGERKERRQVFFYFKLFNNIKDDSEVELAERELTSLFGAVTRVTNFVEEFVNGEFSEAKEILSQQTSGQRLQDAITYELPYGKTQGFKGSGDLASLRKLRTRLGYTREIYVILPNSFSSNTFSDFVSHVNFFIYKDVGTSVIRVITNQFFIEKSAYISKLSRNVKELELNLDTLLHLIEEQSYRIPATETLAVGRRLEDWFAIREEPSLYLTHYMHPYKGKFHPKMARALINYVCPLDEGTVLDNFSGSGTTLVEAQWLGLDSIGVDINPLSSLMSQVKVQCCTIDVDELKAAIDDFLEKTKEAETTIAIEGQGQSTLFEPMSSSAIPERSKFISNLPKSVRQSIAEKQIHNILIAQEIIKQKYGHLDGNPIQEFLLLAVSGTISDISRRTNQPFREVLENRLYNLWGRVYLAKRLQSVLMVNFGSGRCLVGDTRDFATLQSIGGAIKPIADDSIDCVVNSPPYSTALDYIRNDLPQLSILALARDKDELERNLIGNPNLKVYEKDLWLGIEENGKQFLSVPEVGQIYLKRMVSSGREKDAGRVIRFWIDMRATLSEIRRVLKCDGRAAIVLGNNNIQLEKGSGVYEQVPNIEVVSELGKEVGLTVFEIIGRDIEKSMSGMIRSESIIIFKKA